MRLRYNPISRILIFSISLASGLFFFAHKSYAMNISDFLYMPSNNTCYITAHKASGDMGSSYIALYKDGQYVKGSYNFENLNGFLSFGRNELSQFLKNVPAGSGAFTLKIYNCTNDACSGQAGTGGGFNESKGVPNGTFKLVATYDGILADSVYCAGTCPKIVSKEYTKDSDALTIHHNNTYDPGGCINGNYKAYIKSTNETSWSPLPINNVPTEGGANNCRSEISNVSSNGARKGKVEVAYYWTEFQQTLKQSTATIKNQSGSYFIGSFTIDLDTGKIGAGSSSSKELQGNDPVTCEVDVNGKKEEGVLTAIGCIPTDSTGLANWALLFGTVLGGIIAVFKIIQGSFMIMTSTGDPDKLQEGKSTITSAVVGLVVILSAVILLSFLGFDLLGLKNLGFNLNINK